jgi:hypothetical protein
LKIGEYELLDFSGNLEILFQISAKTKRNDKKIKGQETKRNGTRKIEKRNEEKRNE